MPVILRLDGFRFFFYANEGDPLEPAHIHVRQAGAEAKFWLTPCVQLARNDGFDAPTLRKNWKNWCRIIKNACRGLGMNISPKRVWSDHDNLWVELNDGRTLGVPLVWFPRLLKATDEQRASYELSPRGIHWDALDEDISIEGLLRGHGDLTRQHRDVAW